MKSFLKASFTEQINVSVDNITYGNDIKEKTITIPISKYDELYRQQGLYSRETERANNAEREVATLKNEILFLQEQLQEAYKKIAKLT